MRIFTCSACQQTTYFENVTCTNCGHALAYLPDHRLLSALEKAEDAGPEANLWVALAPKAKNARYRLCDNGVQHAACNWTVPESDPDPLCAACRLNDVIPNLSKPGALAAWQKIERAKRRLLYTLYELGLPVESRAERPENGLQFSFMADGDDGKEKVFTGHADGLITININEADDPFREQVRTNMGEAYRTLLGHFRHEVGHYFWDRLIRDTPWIDHYRALFGDERADYGESLQRHYDNGPPADWGQRFVSAYATMHPWEDWAETWAHYLHMVDTLGTARAYGMVLRPKPQGRSAELAVNARSLDFEDFDDLMTGWVPMTLALNGLNRSMGLGDPYPFVLSEKAVEKLRFVHEVVEHWNSADTVVDKVRKRWPAVEPGPYVAPPPPPAPENPAPLPTQNAPADASTQPTPDASAQPAQAPDAPAPLPAPAPQPPVAAGG
ncbi:MAG: putative zinc-binding peptidase [Polyangiales bacterium]